MNPQLLVFGLSAVLLSSTVYSFAVWGSEENISGDGCEVMLVKV